MKETKEYLKRKLNKNDTVVVSCSGGPDSMCLLSLVAEIKDEYNLNIICAHVNHKVRTESEEEESFVFEYCEKNNIKFELLTIKKYNKKNFHDDARVQRYSFLDELMKKYNAKYLMTAHHGDDLIETILMRIQRGSNLTGYAGFKKESIRNNYQVIRPLIYVTKKEIIEYNKKNNIEYRIDKTNFSDVYTRNRYRNHFLPLLKEESEDIHRKYINFSKELNEYDEYIKGLIHKKGLIINNKINLTKFNLEDEFIKKKTIEYLISQIQQENEFYVTNNIVKEILKLLASNKPNGYINLPNNFIGIKSYLEFYIDRQKNTEEYNIIFTDMFENEDWIIKTAVTNEDKSNYTFRFLSEELELPIHIRTRKPHDKIEVKNLNGSKKVKDIMIEEKIPSYKRNSWPIIVDNKNNILGIPGIKKSKFDKDNSQKYDIIIKCKEK